MTTYSNSMSATKSPLQMGSLLILLLVAAIGYLAIRIIFPDSHGNRDKNHNMAAAQNCLNKYGVHTTMKEPNERIHLICLDLETGDMYDVVYKVRNVVEGITTMKAIDRVVNGQLIHFASVAEWIAAKVAEGKVIIATTEFGPFELLIQPK